MSHKNHLYVFTVILTIVGFLLNLGIADVFASPVDPLTPEAHAIKTPIGTPSATPTPAVQLGAEPEAWLDGSLDPQQFGPMDALIIRFNTPMALESAPHPVLSWPDVNGVSSWDDTRTVLTFAPDSALDSGKTYTFFLDPSLRSKEGRELKGQTEWILHVKAGPQVQSVSPEPGPLAYRHRLIEVEFDRSMKTAVPGGAVQIEPPVDFDLRWKGEAVLQIILEQPLDAGQRYDLTLLGGGSQNAFSAEDGSRLAEDYRWYYWQQPFDIDANLLGERVLAMKFNYALDQDRSGQPFTITPDLKGKWMWYSSKEVRFISEGAIPASQEFTVGLAQALVDSSGLEISTLPAVAFSGLLPVRLSNSDLEKGGDEDDLIAATDLHELRIEFERLVDHTSAEKAFSLSPMIPGRFHWERSSDGSGETLVYTLSELLKLSNIYRLKVDASVLDVQGRKIMLRPYERSFRTNAWGDYLFPTFGQTGDNIQVVDAEGARRIQFGGGGDTARFSAYRFDLIDFARLYADHYHPRHYASNVRDIPIPSDSAPAATWTDVLERKTDDGSVTETLLPANMAPGLYVVNMSAGNVLYDQLFVVLTSNTLVVKDNGDELFVWLTNINGENVPNAEIRLYSSRGEKVREGRTDENGQYRVTIPDGVEPLLVSARVTERGLSGDVTLTGFAGWNSYYPYDYRDRSSRYLPQGQPYLVYIYTERPIYKPGQTVHFKAVIRRDDDVRYSLPNEGTAAKVRVLDARGNTIESLDLYTNGFGTINSAVEVSEGAMLGHYQIEVEVDGVAASRTFQVEDYRKPDYQITLTSLQPEKENKFVRGEEMKVQVHASYYFGEPLANAKLDVKFFYNWPLNAKITGSLVTDANGEATLSFPAPYNPDYDDYYWGASSRYQKIRMEVSVNDGSNQVVTGIHTFSVYPASEQLSLESDGYFAQPGQPYTVTARVTDLSNQPVAGRGLTLTVHSWDRKKFKFAHSGQTTQLQTDAAGTATQELKLEAGYHQLTLAGKDPQGHKIEVTRWVYVFRNRQDWFVRGQSDFLSVSAEKDSYKPYETARFVIESTFSGPALLTFERGSVINTRMIELTAPLTIFESQIIPEHAPNVFVTVNAWQAGSQDVGRYGYPYSYATYADSYLRLAKTQIQVDSSAKALAIKITTDRQTYEPGGKLNATIQVVDSAGKPVLAELSLAVVDEAIYGLSDDFAGDIFQAFYGPRAHSVSAFDSMAPYRVIFEGGMGGGGGDGSVPAARSDFPDTSAWLPVIETDQNGQAMVSIDLPDNTTSWRLSVKAVTLKHQVGETFTNIETKKDVFVRPILPRILTNGDQATLTAFIHNYSEQTQTLTIQLSAPGLEIDNQDEISVSLKPGEVLPVGWRVRVRSAKPTQVRITAKSAKGVLDSILLPLDLQPSAVREVQNQSGRFSGTLTLGLPLPNVERETSEVRLTLNRSMSGTLLNGLEYLTGYPYGCVEQTMSRALPNAVVANAADKLGIGGPQLDASLEPLIRASIQRLYGLQHGDGGWGWWTDDVSDPYQTAWVLFGLGVMDEAGHAIEPKVMDRAAEWLDEYLRRESEPDLRTQAYALFSMAMAGRGDLERTEALASTSVYELDPFSQAALALALHELGGNGQAQGILDILSQSVLKEAGHAYWPQPSYDGEYHSKTMASSIRTTALVLLAYAEIQPDHALVPGIVNYLADQRQGIYGWGTTNETSFTILALTGHLVREEGRIGSTPYEVLVNGRTLAFGTLEVGNASASLEIPLAELHNGVNSLVVTAQGDHPIYFDLATRYDILRSEVDAAGSVQVTRMYLDPVTKEPLGTFTAGQLVRVEVRVQVPENAYFVAVEDRLPGGLEALNEGLNAANQVGMDGWDYEIYPPYRWKEYGYNYKEIRGDRVVFFITRMDKGTRTFTYFARATTPGIFIALPAQAYAMYDPSLWGRSESAGVQIDK